MALLYGHEGRQTIQELFPRNKSYHELDFGILNTGETIIGLL